MSLQNPNLKRDKSCFGSSLAAHAELQRLHLIFMLHTNSKNPSNTDTNTSSKPLFAFKPRQVLLAEHNRRSNMAACASKEEKSSKITPVTPEIKAILHESILHYLHRNGFSKSLKRFQSEAQIQGDTWKASSLRLEDIFCKYNASNADTNSNTNKKPKLGNNEATNEETTSKKKKKKKKGIVESDNGAIEDQSKVTDKMTVESNKKFDQISEDIVVNEPRTKLKKKKKTMLDSGSSGQVEETKPDVLKNGSLEIDDLKKKSKDKKKKIIIQQDKSEPSTINSNESETEVAHKQKKKKKKKKLNTDSVEDEGVQPDVTKKEKSCKKRKRSGSDENDDLRTDAIIIEQSKCQKKEQKSKKEGSEVNEIDTQEKSNKGVGGQENGKLEINGGEKSGSQKSAEKQQNGLAEPKTVNAFQRVKIDQVEFAHEKLQDNSYWAKDGAEIGYGAKAQEVLGQVRGRDFRHEKTKKKRGSYRGGLIDLESRSVKFDYSEEE